MKVIINNYLNARNEACTANQPPFYREPGFILDIDNILTGTEINGNSIWYRCKDDGRYYWSGGINTTQEILDKVYTEKEKAAIYKSAATELCARYRSIAGYTGTAAGYDPKSGANTLFICFETEAQVSVAKIPLVINYRGVAVNTCMLAAGKTQLLAEKDIVADNAPPYAMGGSISQDGAGNSYGTRTIMVSRNGIEYLLTCFHVACHSLHKANKYYLDTDKITGRFPSENRTPGREPFSVKVVEGEFGSQCDYALLKVERANIYNAIPDYIFDTPYTLEELQAPQCKGMSLVLHGATSGERKGTFTAYHAESIVVDGISGFTMTGLIMASKMSCKGDSGAPVLNEENSRLVGYVIADCNAYTLIMPFAQLTKQFSLVPKI